MTVPHCRGVTVTVGYRNQHGCVSRRPAAVPSQIWRENAACARLKLNSTKAKAAQAAAFSPEAHHKACAHTKPACCWMASEIRSFEGCFSFSATRPCGQAWHRHSRRKQSSEEAAANKSTDRPAGSARGTRQNSLFPDRPLATLWGVTWAENTACSASSTVVLFTQVYPWPSVQHSEIASDNGKHT